MLCQTEKLYTLSRYQHVGGTCCVCLQGTSYTSLHGIICQKTGIFINTTENLKFLDGGLRFLVSIYNL